MLTLLECWDIQEYRHPVQSIEQAVKVATTLEEMNTNVDAPCARYRLLDEEGHDITVRLGSRFA